MLGIYQIRNILNDKLYIGSSLDLKARKREHFWQLRNNRNKCGILQNAWNKHGEDNFVFEILEQIENVDSLVIREQHYLDILQPEYNIRKIAESNRGVKRTKEAIEKFIVSNSKKVIQYDLEGNFIKEWDSLIDIERNIKIKSSDISMCCTGKQKTVKGFIFKFKDNYIEYKGSRRKRKYSDEELLKIKTERTSKEYKIFDGTNTYTIKNLKKFCKEKQINYKTVHVYLWRDGVAKIKEYQITKWTK